MIWLSQLRAVWNSLEQFGTLRAISGWVGWMELLSLNSSDITYSIRSPQNGAKNIHCPILVQCPSSYLLSYRRFSFELAAMFSYKTNFYLLSCLSTEFIHQPDLNHFNTRFRLFHNFSNGEEIKVLHRIS